MNEISKIQKHLADNWISCEVSKISDRAVVVSIEWGDWKHDHLACDYLMHEIGYELVDVTETETDGSDTYSADRYYLKVG